MQRQQFQHMHISADHLITTKCPLHQWDVRHKSTRRPTSKGHGRTIQLTGGISSPPQNIIAHAHVMSRPPKANTIQTQSISNTKNITNPTITHADKVMQALAECVKTITGAMGGTTAQDAKDLQRIVKATRAALHKNDAPINNSNAEHQALWVPKLLRVHALPRVPPTTAENQRITRAMSDAQNRKQSSVSRNIVPSSAGRSDPDSQNGKQSSVSSHKQSNQQNNQRIDHNANQCTDSRTSHQTHQHANYISHMRPPSKMTHSTTTQRHQHHRQ
jgi:hypothetical protein